MITQVGGIVVPGWENFPWLRHGFSSRAGGRSTVYGEHELNLGFTRDDDPATVVENRTLVLNAVAPGGARMVTVRQVHGTSVKQVHPGELDSVAEADGLMTDVESIVLGIQVADCVPVLVADVRRRVVAAFHAGWRGTAAGIVERGIGRMREAYGTDSTDLIAAIGPSIRSCCYTVGEELRSAFAERFRYSAELFTQSDGRLHLDLAEANRHQLLQAGVAAERISVLEECTACAQRDGQRKYFSHRADRGFTGRAMGLIGVARE